MSNYNNGPIIIPFDLAQDDGDDDDDWDDDSDIAGPMFYRLQEFFVMEMEQCPVCALELARTFMRFYAGARDAIPEANGTVH